MIGAVVLAAGRGTRFEGDKVVAPLRGTAVVRHVVDRLARAGLSPIVVVAAPGAAELRRVLEGTNAQVVENPQRDDGLSASLARLFAQEGMRLGLAARRVDKLRELAAATGAVTIACDAGKPEQVEALFSGLSWVFWPRAASGASRAVASVPASSSAGPLRLSTCPAATACCGLRPQSRMPTSACAT